MDEDTVLQEHILVDFTECQYVTDFWNRIGAAFDFDEAFGKNWDAFEDLLTVECPAHRVTVIGANTLPKDWKTAVGVPYPEMIRRILQRNQEFKERYDYAFDYEFIDA